MLIPECCKNCSNKGKLLFGPGCFCDAPSRCGKMVEDNASQNLLNNVISVETKDSYETQLKEKDHKIEVFGEAYKLACETITELYNPSIKYLKKKDREIIYRDTFNMFYDSFIDQAKEQLKDEKN